MSSAQITTVEGFQGKSFTLFPIILRMRVSRSYSRCFYQHRLMRRMRMRRGTRSGCSLGCTGVGGLARRFRCTRHGRCRLCACFGWLLLGAGAGAHKPGHIGRQSHLLLSQVAPPLLLRVHHLPLLERIRPVVRMVRGARVLHRFLDDPYWDRHKYI